MLAAVEGGMPVVEYTPAEIKRAVVGYGRAEKPQVEQMVKLLLGLDAVPTPHDAADALAVAICHLHQSGVIAAAGARTRAAEPRGGCRRPGAGGSTDRRHDDRVPARAHPREASQPRHRRRGGRRLRRAGAALDLLHRRRAGRRDRAARPHARARGSARALRVRHAARAGAVRAADRRQRHRPEAGAGGAVGHRAARPGRRHPARRRRAAHAHSRRRQEDRRADRRRAARSAAEGARAVAGEPAVPPRGDERRATIWPPRWRISATIIRPSTRRSRRCSRTPPAPRSSFTCGRP